MTAEPKEMDMGMDTQARRMDIQTATTAEAKPVVAPEEPETTLQNSWLASRGINRASFVILLMFLLIFCFISGYADVRTTTRCWA